MYVNNTRCFNTNSKKFVGGGERHCVKLYRLLCWVELDQIRSIQLKETTVLQVGEVDGGGDKDSSQNTPNKRK